MLPVHELSAVKNSYLETFAQYKPTYHFIYGGLENTVFVSLHKYY